MQNTIERAAILSNGPDIERSDLQLPAPSPPPRKCLTACSSEEFLWEGPLEEVSAARRQPRRALQDPGCALRESKWNKTRAAEKLGVSYKTLLNKIRNLGLEN